MTRGLTREQAAGAITEALADVPDADTAEVILYALDVLASDDKARQVAVCHEGLRELLEVRAADEAAERMRKQDGTNPVPS